MVGTQASISCLISPLPLSPWYKPINISLNMNQPFIFFKPSIWLHLYGTMIYKRYVFDLHAISGTELLKILEFHIRGVSYIGVFVMLMSWFGGHTLDLLSGESTMWLKGWNFQSQLHWLLRWEERLEVELILNGQWFNQPCQCNYTLMCVSHSVMSNSLQPHGLWPTKLLCLWGYPGKNTGVDCHSLLQRTFPIQGLNPGLLHCRQIKCKRTDRVWRVPRSIYMGKFRKSGTFREHGSFSPHPFLILCPMYLFHLDVSELCLFVINQ